MKKIITILLLSLALTGCKQKEYEVQTTLIHTQLQNMQPAKQKIIAKQDINLDISAKFKEKQTETQEQINRQQEQEEKRRQQQIQQKTVQSKTEPITTICQNDNVEPYWIDAINAQLNKIPQTLRNQFVNQGWNIYCTNKDVDKTYFNGQFGSVMGVTLYDEHKIYIENRQSAVTESTIHEFGHYYDYSLGYASHQEPFLTIYDTECQAFQNTFATPGYFNQEELFAEAFWRYLTADHNTFRTNTPQLYAFFQQLLG